MNSKSSSNNINLGGGLFLDLKERWLTKKEFQVSSIESPRNRKQNDNKNNNEITFMNQPSTNNYNDDVPLSQMVKLKHKKAD